MNKDYRLKRHSGLWESQNKQIKKVLFGGFLAAYIIISNILTPYERSMNVINMDMTNHENKIKQIDTVFLSIEKLTATLQDVQKVIWEKPWDLEKEKLKEDFRRMTSDNTTDLDVFQKLVALGFHNLQRI